MDQLGRVALVFIRVAELRAAHLDDGAPTLDVVAQLFLPYPVLQRFRAIPCIGAGGRLEESSETVCNRLKRSLALGTPDEYIYRWSIGSLTLRLLIRLLAQTYSCTAYLDADV